MSYRPELAIRARNLREQGVSVPTIAIQLGIAKSTAFRWVHGVVLSRAIVNKLVSQSVYGRQRGLARIREIRELQHAQRMTDAEKTVRRVMDKIDRDGWQAIAALLFWCEGSKRHLSSMRFVNSDPVMVRVFLKALKLGFNTDADKWTALLHLHGYHQERKMIAYWSKVTGIASEHFYRSYRKPNSGRRKRDQYHGCIAIRYGDSNLARKLDALYRTIAKRMGA